VHYLPPSFLSLTKGPRHSSSSSSAENSPINPILTEERASWVGNQNTQ
jgi:hypothetical protein